MSVLTNRTGTKITGQLLTNKRDVPFILGFRYPLEKKFTLTELEKRNNKELQGFLDKVSQMSVQQVDESLRASRIKMILIVACRFIIMKSRSPFVFMW